MLAKTQQEEFGGYSGSLRTYSIRQVPDINSGPEGGMLETMEIYMFKDYGAKELCSCRLM